jgi:hypothetical protein
MYPQRRSFLWYLIIAGLVVFSIKDPSGAAFLARAGLTLLSDVASGLSKLVSAN